FLKIAATLAILVSVGIWALLQKSPGEKLYRQYFTPDPGLPTVMGNTDNFTFNEAMVYYKQGDYGAAIAQWEGLLPQKRDNDTLNYFLGAAHLAHGNVPEAIPFLE